MFNKITTLSERLAWWKAIVCQYDPLYRTLKKVKGQVLMNYVDKLLLDDYELIYTDFLDENILDIEASKESPNHSIK